MALVTVSGVSAAIAAPILANTTVPKQIEKNSGEKEPAALVATSSLERCVTQSYSGGTTVDFGGSNPSGICGTIEGDDPLPAELSKVFTLTGNSPSNGMHSGNVGQIYCKYKDEERGPQSAEDIGLITLGKVNDSNCNGSEYLELKSNDYQNTIFLKKELNRSEPSSYNVGLCTADNCGDVSSPFTSGRSEQIVKETVSFGKPVTFRKK